MPDTHRERILEALRISSRPLDDDELSRRTGIAPRQTVNMICRRLEDSGTLRRYVGSDGKIVNELIRGPDSSETQLVFAVPQEPTALPPSRTGHSRPPGSSQEQRDAERVMLDLLGARIGRALEPTRLTVASGARVEIDGVDAERTVLVECWAHQGSPKAAQKHKVLADAFKLTWVATTLPVRPQLILCLSDPEAAAPFLPSSQSWAAHAMSDLGVAVSVVELPDDLRHRILEAQTRQYR